MREQNQLRMGKLHGKRVVLWADRHDNNYGSGDLFRVAEILKREGCSFTAVFSTAIPYDLLGELSPDVILALLHPQFRMPLELLRRSHLGADLPPVILLLGLEDPELYLEGMQDGAFDCLTLPIDEQELIRLAAQAVEVGEARLAVA